MSSAQDGESKPLKTAEHIDIINPTPSVISSAVTSHLTVPGAKTIFGKEMGTALESAEYMGALSKRLATVESQKWYEGDRLKLMISALGITLIRDGLLPLVAVYLSIINGIADDEVGNLVGLQGWAMVVVVIPAGLLTDTSHYKQWWAILALIVLAGCTTVELLDEWFFPGLEFLWIHYLMRVGIGFTGPVYDRLLSGMTMGIVGLNMFDQQWANMALAGQLFKFTVLGVIIIFSLFGAGWMIFALCAGVCVIAIMGIMSIPASHIDHELVKGVRVRTTERERQKTTKINPQQMMVSAREKWYVPYLNIMKDKDAVVFVIFVFCFHFGNAFLLPLAMLEISDNAGEAAVAWAIGPMIVSEISAFFWTAGLKKLMPRIGRRTIFGFGALLSISVRAFLTLWITDLAAEEAAGGGGEPMWARMAILATMTLDGLGAGVYGVMHMVVAADLMKGSGVFNSFAGMVNLADKLGGIASAFLGGHMAEELGRRYSLIILGSIGIVAALLYFLFIRETLHERTVQPAEKKVIKAVQTTAQAPTLYLSGNEKLREVAMRQAGARGAAGNAPEAGQQQSDVPTTSNYGATTAQNTAAAAESDANAGYNMSALAADATAV